MADRHELADRVVGAFGPVRFPVFAPSDAERSGFQAPAAPQEPPLHHVHGFHAAARPPVLFLSERRAAVAAGKLVVALDIDTRRQQFMRGHSDAVTCLAHTPEQELGASAQVLHAGAKRAEVVLWCAETMQELATFVFHQADVEALGFIQGGEILVSISADRDHTLALWGTAREGWFRFKRKEKAPLVVCSAYKTGGVHGVLATPGGPDLPTQFVTYGTAHVKFWQSDRVAKLVDGRRGSFIEASPKSVVAAAFSTRDRLVAGSSEGEIYLFEGTRAVRRVQHHKFSVALLLPLRESLLVVYSRGTCSLLRGLSASPRTQKQAPGAALDIDLYGLNGAPDTRMQTPFVGGAAWKLSGLLLSSRTDLLFLDLSDGLNGLRSVTVLLTQPSRPLTAVCAHPLEPRIFTGALDGGVRCYRSDTHMPLPERSFRASGGVTCLAVSACAQGDSAWLAVGCDDSTLSVLGESPFRYVLRRCLSETKAVLTCARFSPCSAAHPLWLAVGTSDGCIHTFKIKEPATQSAGHSGAETVVKVATLRGHAAAVVDVCFADTLPCSYLLSVDATGQALAFDVPMGRRLQSVSLVKDVSFSPWTVPIGWQVLGCWTPQKAIETAPLPLRRFCEITGRSAIAASDATSPAVELYPFPCPVAPDLPPVRLEGPAVPVAALLHAQYSECLLAASDTVLFSWKFPGGGVAPPAALDSGATPLRPVQGGAVYDTPEGKKRIMAMDGPLTQSPAERRRAKENLGASPPQPAAIKEKAPSTPTPARDHAEASPPPRPVEAWGGVPLGSQSDLHAGNSSITPDAPTPGWAIQPPALALAASGPPAAGKRSSPASKIGAPEGAQAREAAGCTALICEETATRARIIHERQQFDSVGLLLGGQEHQSSAAVVAPATGYREAAAGRFQLRMHSAASHYEVEVRLPAGRLLRVLRNPLRRTLTFEGERLRNPERLLVQLPPGFDLEAAPKSVERDFEKGRCFVAVRSRAQKPEGVTCNPQASDLIDTEL